VVNLGGTSRADIQERLAAIRRSLPFELEPLEEARPASHA
jgi:hypothetical protein